MIPATPKGLLKSFGRYLLVGGTVTACVYLVFDGCLRAGMQRPVASAVSWAAGVALGYLPNKRFTFELKRGSSVREVATFVGGYLLQLGLGIAGYELLMGRLHWDRAPAFVAVTGASMVFTFLFMRFAVFRPSSGPQPA